MKVLVVRIHYGKIVEHNGQNTSTETEKSLVSDGWSIAISENGRVICKKSEVSDNIPIRVKLDICANGKGKATLVKGKERATVLKTVNAPNHPLITLSLSTEPLTGGIGNARKQVSVG